MNCYSSHQEDINNHVHGNYSNRQFCNTLCLLTLKKTDSIENKSMTNLTIIFLILFNFFIHQSLTQIPPVVPLTNALTAVYCHDLNEAGIMTIRCGTNEKIRMLDAFDVVVKNKSHLPLQCLQKNYFSMVHGDISNNADCKVHTSFTSACSGRENCTLHMQRIHLNSPNENCHNQLVDYTIAFFECISDVFIHDICSSQAITSAWGTLKTPNFPNPYTSNDDCWCKLSTQVQHRLLLSVIIFQLIPYDQNCTGAGLYLQSSDKQRSTQCTYLQPGHNYLSDTNSLYINFYSRTSTVRGGFWIIYEASHFNAEVHLHCGSREKIGVPSEAMSTSPPPISSSYNHGWSRLAYNDPPNPTTLINDHMMDMRLIVTTPRPLLDKNFKINPLTTAAGAFTYPYGHLTTFELAYGPRGWFLKFPFASPRITASKFLQTTTATTTQLPVVKWNSTWRYIRGPWARIFTTTRTTTKTTTTTVSTTTISTQTTVLESTTIVIPTSTSEIITTEQNTVPFSSTLIDTSTPQSVTIQQRLLGTDKSQIDDSSGSIKSLTKMKTTIKSMIYLPASSYTLKTTLPSPTPWYSPAGPFDWWQWQWYTTKFPKVSLRILTINQTPLSSTRTTTTTLTTSSSTTRSIINLSNTTSRTAMESKTKATVDYFKWPYLQSISSTRRQPDYYEDEYLEWSDYFATTKIQNTITTNSFISIFPDSQRQKSQQLSFSPTTSNWHLNNLGMTINTPSSKRHYTQQNTGTNGERNAVAGIQLNEGITHTNAQNIIQQQNKQNSEEHGWLSRTDMTIVAVSILFVILLVFINLILFAVRKHRRRIQGRHLLCASLPSSINDRRSISNNHLQSPKLGDSTDSLINITNNNNNDILPAVGEIVLWDEKDQGGYMIDNHGEWAKIEGRQWLGSNILKNCSKTSFSKSFRSRFQLIRQSNKKPNDRHQQPPPITPNTQQQQQMSKFPLLMDTPALSPVPEADDYQSSQFSSSDKIIQNSETKLKNTNKKPQQTIKTIQALIHTEQDCSDEYYKRFETGGDDSNYTTMHENIQGEYSITDQQTDRSLGNEINAGGSVIVSVPTMLRREDDIGITTDGGESIYNQNYSIRSLIENKNLPAQVNYLQTNNTKSFTTKQSVKTYKPSTNNSIIVGYCQTDFQPLNPKLLVKSLLAEHQQFYSGSQSLQLSTYDSGFFDDQTIDNLAITPDNESMSMDEISSSKNGENLPSNDLLTINLKKIKSTKMKTYC